METGDGPVGNGTSCKLVYTRRMYLTKVFLFLIKKKSEHAQHKVNTDIDSAAVLPHDMFSSNRS